MTIFALKRAYEEAGPEDGRAAPHDIAAVEDSAFLQTVAWPDGAER